MKEKHIIYDDEKFDSQNQLFLIVEDVEIQLYGSGKQLNDIALALRNGRFFFERREVVRTPIDSILSAGEL